MFGRPHIVPYTLDPELADYIFGSGSGTRMSRTQRIIVCICTVFWALAVAHSVMSGRSVPRKKCRGRIKAWRLLTLIALLKEGSRSCSGDSRRAALGFLLCLDSSEDLVLDDSWWGDDWIGLLMEKNGLYADTKGDDKKNEVIATQSRKERIKQNGRILG